MTLHSTWRGLLSGWITSGLLAGAGTWAVAAAGFNVVSTAVFGFGWLLLLTVLFDLPVASTLDSEGVTRRMPLRRQVMPFDERSILTRARPSAVRFTRGLEHGGLVLRQGRRKYLLVDRAESRDEYFLLDEVVDVAGTPGEGVGVDDLPVPPETAPPTWLYRRAKWRPDWASRR